MQQRKQRRTFAGTLFLLAIGFVCGVYRREIVSFGHKTVNAVQSISH